MSLKPGTVLTAEAMSVQLTHCDLTVAYIKETISRVFLLVEGER